MCEIMDLPPVLHISIQGLQYTYLFKYLNLQMSPEQEDILGMLECLFCVHYLTKDIFSIPKFCLRHAVMLGMRTRCEVINI